MKIFNKKECCCSPKETAKQTENKSDIKVLGSGCAKCNALEDATRTALADLGLQCTIEHVTDYTQIASYGVMSTPALVIKNKVVAYGKVLSVEEVKAILKKEL